MNSMHVLNSLGWSWRDNGVVLCVVVDQQRFKVFVPLREVAMVFERELDQAGVQGMGGMGACSGGVGGIFGDIAKAVKKVGRKATRAVKKGARTIRRTAKKAVRNPLVRAALPAIDSTRLYLKARKNPMMRQVMAAHPAGAALDQGVSSARALESTLRRGTRAADAMQRGAPMTRRNLNAAREAQAAQYVFRQLAAHPQYAHAMQRHLAQLQAAAAQRRARRYYGR